MKTYVALLRGINVSGQKKIRMADLSPPGGIGMGGDTNLHPEWEHYFSKY